VCKLLPENPTEEQAKQALLLLFLAERTQYPGFAYLVLLWEDRFQDYIRRIDPQKLTMSNGRLCIIG
jgi:hypothetical protein